MSRYRSSFRPYVSVAKRRVHGSRQLAALKEKLGRESQPVIVDGRRIAHTFWGKAWCDNLERYSDFANRLPRGRTYVRNGSVVDLVADGCTIRALVMGRDLYEVTVTLKPLPKARWTSIRSACAGGVGSVLELLRGNLSAAVMAIVTQEGEGLFPTPREIALACSCPDWAYMCKHVAAVLYGIGARLDEEPQTLFTLRGVSPEAMVAEAIARAAPARGPSQAQHKRLRTRDLSKLFGVTIEAPPDE